MSIYIILETIENDSNPRRRWRLHLPRAYEKDGYRQCTSFNSFFHGMSRRNWKKKINGKRVLYYPQLEIEYKLSPFGQLDDKQDLPLVDIYSLWDFYKAIGYDYKTRKYINA